MVRWLQNSPQVLQYQQEDTGWDLGREVVTHNNIQWYTKKMLATVLNTSLVCISATKATCTILSLHASAVQSED